ncbi:carboxymuconolactone decarboxylase family protein [Flavobacterium arcticum]|uniref:Carboxymuconolactone decarboxylase family protein n=1 Tax=Flavobacterium arcticum TaxID=1784713 RepID=A0A345HC79_9FLAO|nr:carboxymuconolactone decarboxylase family protein [Flavobacterium arcticum]AXG74189.1 carboxymuconolactone decarboxylase family protein [Flavobacterium arcticum]KAF2508223.1 carboxymuconolactone decarboxylase family protein [Flavobacterium arcticum]
METRFRLHEVNPMAWKAVLDFEGYFAKSGVTKTHKELIKIRASQINGCAFCLDMHTKDARENGETEQRIYTLSTWRDTTFFTPEERAILALTEEATNISGGVSDEVYNNAVSLLGEEYIAKVLMDIIVINSWNRIAITTKIMPK